MKKKNNNTLFMILIFVLLVGCLGGLTWISKKQSNASTSDTKYFKPYVASNYSVKQDFELDKQPMIGNKSAPVTMVIFTDFSCPFCRNFDLTMMPKIQKDFIDTGKAKLYFMSFPFINESSYRTAVAAESVYQNDPKDFYLYYQALYRAQQSEDVPNWANDTSLVDIAKSNHININYTNLKNDIDTYKNLDSIYRDRAIGEKFGVTGTPSLFINNQLVDPTDYNAITSTINNASKGSN